MKRTLYFAVILLVLFSVLVSCTSGSDTEPASDFSEPATTSFDVGSDTSVPDNDSNQPRPDHSTPTTAMVNEPPLQEADWAIAVPNFLTEEQQLLYRRAYSLYRHMFSGDTNMIEYAETLDADNSPMYGTEPVQIGEYSYVKSQGRYQRWIDFDSVIHSVFTEDFFAGINQLSNGYEIYLEHDGALYFLDLGRESGAYYNENFADDFILERKIDSEILFTLIGHYSNIFPRDGETPEDYEERRKQEFDYTLEFPIKMVLTQDGWRFDEFHSAPAEDQAKD